MSQHLIVTILVFSLLPLAVSIFGLFFRVTRKPALLVLLASIGVLLVFDRLNAPFVEAHEKAQQFEGLKADALRHAADAKADALYRAAGFFDAADRKMALAAGFAEAKTWGFVRSDVAAIVQSYPDNSLTNADCKYDDPGSRVQTLMFPATKQYPFGTRDVFRCLSKEEAVASALRALQVAAATEARKAKSNVLISRGAVACQMFTDAEIAFQLTAANQQDKIRTLDHCYFIAKGRELMGIQTAGDYALVAPMDSLNDRTWTYSGWLSRK